MGYCPKIFLSGGFRSNWQEILIRQLGDKFIYFNPREHGLSEAESYTIWDIHFVKECDVFFAYMEATNPSGYVLAFELGIAYALNKTIVLVDERSGIDPDFSKYFKIVHKPSGVVLSKFEDGIKFLKSFSF